MEKLNFFFKKVIILSIIINPCPLFAQRDGHYWGDDGYATVGAWIFLLAIISLFYIARFFIRTFSSDGTNNTVITTETKNKALIKIFSKGDDRLGLISLNHNFDIKILKSRSLLPIEHNEKLGCDELIQIIPNSKIGSEEDDKLYLSILRYFNKISHANADFMQNNIIRYWNNDLYYWSETSFSLNDFRIKTIIDDGYYKNRQEIIKDEELRNDKVIKLDRFEEGEYLLSIKGNKGNYIWKPFSLKS